MIVLTRFPEYQQTMLNADLTDPTGGSASELLYAFIAGAVLLVIAFIVFRLAMASRKEGNEGAKAAGLEIWKLFVIVGGIGACVAIAGYAYGLLAGYF